MNSRIKWSSSIGSCNNGEDSPSLNAALVDDDAADDVDVVADDDVEVADDDVEVADDDDEVADDVGDVSASCDERLLNALRHEERRPRSRSKRNRSSLSCSQRHTPWCLFESHVKAVGRYTVTCPRLS